jgi:2-polyprenyl-3-methyl-5-hydroxy-6-metoxy-1,4-benzoquinol methylase
MNEFRRRLIQAYASHYQRLNSNADGRGPDTKMRRSFDLTYGPLLSGLPMGSKVLDLGCGTGLLLGWLRTKPQVVPVGVDSSESQIRIARKLLPGIEISLDDGLEFLLKNSRSFRGIFCNDVLEHISGEDNLLRWVESCVEALQPGGFFVARSPNAANLSACYSRYLDLTHERCFTSQSILQLFEVAGLQNCRILPLRVGHFSGRARIVLEQAMHQVLFRLLGRGPEPVFTMNICAVGFRNGTIQ